jgi:hypothetical protein
VALREALRPERIEAIRRAVTVPMPSAAITAEYKAPWFDPRVIEAGSVDLVVSQSVLEHVVDLPATYRALYQWVKPGGWMSHQIDFQIARTHARAGMATARVRSVSGRSRSGVGRS